MACPISKGRLDYSCKTIVGGLNNIYVMAFDRNLKDDVTAGEIASFTSAPNVHKFELLNDANTFDETNESAGDAGTSTFSQAGSLILKSQDLESQVALQQLTKTKVQIIVEDRMGNHRVAGVEFGCDVTIGTVSGGGISDMNGYNVAFVAKGTQLAPYLGTTAIGEMVESASPVNPN